MAEDICKASDIQNRASAFDTTLQCVVLPAGAAFSPESQRAFVCRQCQRQEDAQDLTAARVCPWRWARLRLITGLLAGIAAVTAPANDAADSAPPPAQLSRVVVVGTNDWGQASAGAPLSISVFSNAQLDHAGILSARELSRAVPNFSQSHAGLRSFSDNYVMRGIGNTEFMSDAAVVLYVDDAPFGDTGTYTTDLLAVESVEVFRGPQGSRFGKNAAAGVINIITRKPANQFAAEGRASYATFDTQRYQLLANGPVAKDKLHFSVAGQFASSDGFIHNDFLDTEADERQGINGRAALLWSPAENWTVDLSATGDKFDDGVGIVSLNGDPRRTSGEFDGEFKQRVNSQSLRIRGDVRGIAITSVTARRDFDLDPFKFDLDFTPLAGNTGIVKYAQVQWSQELRVQPVESPEKWHWHSGFFFSTAGTDVDRPTDFFIPPLALAGSNDISSAQTTDNYALFGEATHTPHDKLAITLGLRLDYTVRQMRRTRTSSFGGPPPSQASGDFFNAAPMLTIGYHLTDTVLGYVSTGLGFKPGGFSPFIDPPASPGFDTETMWANEVGVKSTWLDGKITANVALFYYDVTDYQVEQFAPVGFDFTTANAPHARTMGTEVELAVRPAAGWEFSGFFGYTDARLESFTDPFTGATVRDTRPPFVAEFNAGISAQYQHPSGLFARIEYSAFGDTFYDAANSSEFRQSAYGLLGARVGFERGHFGVWLFGENLTDTEYFTKKIPPLNAGATGQPRTFGVMVTARY